MAWLRQQKWAQWASRDLGDVGVPVEMWKWGGVVKTARERIRIRPKKISRGSLHPNWEGLYLPVPANFRSTQASSFLLDPKDPKPRLPILDDFQWVLPSCRLAR